MNVPLLKPTWEERHRARLQFAEYQNLEKSGRSTAADRVAQEVYRQVQRGRTLLSLHQALRSGGVDVQGRPKLAIVRADARWCFFRQQAGIKQDTDDSSRIAISEFCGSTLKHAHWPSSAVQQGRGLSVVMPQDLFPVRLSGLIRAQVPSIPPAIRPRADLSRYHILWEADWDEPPYDPFLLRRVTTDWFVVLAQWNLTEVERSILAAASYAESY